MLSTCGSRGVSAACPAAQAPGTAPAEAGPSAHLTEKEARIAKEKELGIYKEHKVGACGRAQPECWLTGACLGRAGSHGAHGPDRQVLMWGACSSRMVCATQLCSAASSTGAKADGTETRAGLRSLRLGPLLNTEKPLSLCLWSLITGKYPG